jgi:ABC-type sugar transport system ATPase subunit
MSRLELKGLSRRFGAVRALDRIDLSVEEGEFCVLLGPSGCGKSTLLRCVAGLEAPTDGEILLDGQQANDWEPKRRNVAMVFQSYALYPHYDVRRNLEFPLRMRRMARDEIDRRVRDAAALLHIEDLLDRKPRALSGGQRQRVAIGRAIVRDPSLFLFDEPLSNLDARLRQEMRIEIVRLHRRLQRTILYVTHDQAEAMTLGQKLVVMRAGRIEQIGAPAEVYTRPATEFVAAFVGTPPMNLVPGRIETGEFLGESLCIALPRAAHTGGATLGVRPQHVRLEEGHGRAQLEWIEELGAERYAHLRCGDLPLTARLPDDATPSEGEEVPFRFEADRLHLFADGVRVS